MTTITPSGLLPIAGDVIVQSCANRDTPRFGELDQWPSWPAARSMRGHRKRAGNAVAHGTG